ncbi:hypothetical protein L0Y59_05040 [Candidatus Uhrbacteria bacterium]|nr:hypothetical protein [Candidatus Uhrbacteria bacterium]
MVRDAKKPGETKPATKRPSKILGEYYGSLFLLIIIAFLAATAFVLKPMLDTVKATNVEVTVELDRLEASQAYLDSLERSIAAAQGISPDVLQRVDRLLPRETGIPELLVLFGETAKRNNVQISNLSFSEESDSARLLRPLSTVSEVTINVNVGAMNYAEFKRFLRDLETSLRLFDVSAVNFSSTGGDTGYALLLKTYVYKGKPVAPPTPPQL